MMKMDSMVRCNQHNEYIKFYAGPKPSMLAVDGNDQPGGLAEINLDSEMAKWIVQSLWLIFGDQWMQVDDRG